METECDRLRETEAETEELRDGAPEAEPETKMESLSHVTVPGPAQSE